MNLHKRGSILAPLTLALAAMIGCGTPPNTSKKQQRFTAPVGDISGCDQYGFAGTQSQTDWTTDCGIPGSPVVNADGNPTGQVLEMKVFFNCHTYDGDTWYEQMEWDQCLNGAQHPSNGDATITYGPYDCHLVDGVCGFAQLPDNPLEVDGTTPDGILLRALINNINDARAKLQAQGDTGTLTQSLQLLDAAQLYADLSDEAFVKKARALGVQSVSVGMRLVDLAVNFVPGVALGRDAIIVLTGTNPITGETVSDVERSMIAGALLVPAFLEGSARSMVDLGEAVEDVAASSKAEAAIAQDLAGAMTRADEEAADLVHSLPCTPSRLGTGRLAPLGTIPCGKLGIATGQLAAEAEETLTGLRNGQVSFGTAKTTDYSKTFFDSYGWELKKEVGQVHHAVPKYVLDNYPGVISAEEMHSLENLRGIAVGPDGTALHQGTINSLWNDFFKSCKEQGRIPTREELLSYALEIDNMYGSEFIPPIR